MCGVRCALRLSGSSGKGSRLFSLPGRVQCDSEAVVLGIGDSEALPGLWHWRVTVLVRSGRRLA